MKHGVRQERVRGKAAILLLGLVVLALAAAWFVRGRIRSQTASPGGGSAVTKEDRPSGPGMAALTDSENDILRERVAALYSQGATGAALDALKPLLDRPQPEAVDLVSAAVIRLQKMADLEGARALLLRAAKLSPNDARVAFNLGQCDFAEGNFQAAAEHFRRVLVVEPEDLPTKLALAECLELLEKPLEAEALYREVLERGINFGGSWYKIALYRLSRFAFEDPARAQEAEGLIQEHDLLEERGVVTPNASDVQRGNLGQVSRPAPRGNQPSDQGVLPRFAGQPKVLTELARMSQVALHDFDNDGLLDILAFGPSGCAFALQREGGAWEVVRVTQTACEAALAFDLGDDDDLDVLVFERDAAAPYLFVGSKEESENAGPIRWARSDKVVPWSGGPPADWLAVDYDHEGDVDLFAVGAFGRRLLRNDGVRSSSKQGVFVDVTQEAGLASDVPHTWCESEDFDTDQDVDLLAGNAQTVALASNLRGGRFENRSAWCQALEPQATRPVLADLDGDARPDVWAGGRFYRGQPSGTLAEGRAPKAGCAQAIASWQGARPQALDVDLDGSLDVIGQGGGCLSIGLESERPFALEGVPAGARFGDLDAMADGKLALDMVVATQEGVKLWRGDQALTTSLLLGFRGTKDNRRGIGATVEVRAGKVYRRIYWRGEQELVGLGKEKQVDYVWVTWPNGVQHQDTSREPGDRSRTKDGMGLIQPSGLPGSCPFLYTWNGTRYVFISDVLGITPLGLPMAPGMLVPPDHDEYVLVRGSQLAPKDGLLELQITEELREVTYLDRVRLEVVDHPTGVRVLPDERFTFPPFPKPHIHSLSERVAPSSVVDQDGRDWSAELAQQDGHHALPFEPAPTQFLGLATPHSLVLTFDPARVAKATKLRLVLTGWFYWTDASVNMASARDPDWKFVPPLLFVPDAGGATDQGATSSAAAPAGADSIPGWRQVGGPIGFPAGKTKSMVIDVSQALDRQDPRLRLFSTLRLYWDEIALYVDDDDAPLVVTKLEPASANLWERGWSQPQVSVAVDQPELFDWDHLTPFPRWNQHPGRYTRLGDVLPLLGTIDDQFVIMGSGDSLCVKFDAKQLPPLAEGWERDYLVFLDGWAKDKDPNTHQAQYVTPLPFHGMSSYPYPGTEGYPSTPEHERYRREWLTRPARRPIGLRGPPAPIVAGAN